MSRRPVRIATTRQLERSVREAGFDTYVLPEVPSLDLHRSIAERRSDGKIFAPFLEKHDIDLVVDYNTTALTLIDSPNSPDDQVLTTAALGIPYVSCYLDPITSTMSQVSWADHWHLLESDSWIKWIPESVHSEELMRLGIPNVLTMPMAAANDDFDTSPPTQQDAKPVVSFMGHPATTWFGSDLPVLPEQLHAGLTAAAVKTDMPDMSFHKIYYDLYEFAKPPTPQDDRANRAALGFQYYQQKFLYNAFLAVKHRDRFMRFLKLKLGDLFELVGDGWKEHCGLEHTPRIWDLKELHERMRRVPICLNVLKGNWETGLVRRHFEVPAYGGFMLSYETEELATCFEIGKECDVFKNEVQLLDKIEYYMANPKKRRDIAAAGQQRVLKEHLYSHRITTLVELLEKANVLPKKGIAKTGTKEDGNQKANVLDIVIPPVRSSADETNAPPLKVPESLVAAIVKDPEDKNV